MPIRRAQNTMFDANGIVACVNQTYATLRPALPPLIEDWTVATVVGFRDAGYTGWVWARASDGRIMACLIGGVEQHNGEPWFAIKILAARLNEIPDIGDNREAAVVRAVKVGIQEMVAQRGTVGATFLLMPGFGRLLNFLTRKFPSGVREIEDGQVRLWHRHAPGLPELEAALAEIGPE